MSAPQNELINFGESNETSPISSSAKTVLNLDKEDDGSSAVSDSMDTSEFAAGSLPSAPELNSLPTMTATKSPRLAAEEHKDKRLSLTGHFGRGLRP
jgi:hypothetical protein